MMCILIFIINTSSWIMFSYSTYNAFYPKLQLYLKSDAAEL